MKMIFIFIDGFGIGEKAVEKNPIFAADTPNLDYIFETANIFTTDASMGVPGLPQSATGQTTIFTGENAPLLLGKHMSGQPMVTLKKVINKNNLFMQLKKKGLRITNSNVYREEYLIKMLDKKDRRHRPSVTSVMTMAAGMSFRTIEDYKNGFGIYHDITGQIIRDSGYSVDIISANEAAQRLYNISRDYDFTLYEHFMTDIIGHKMDMELAIKEIELLDTFFCELLSLVNFEEDIIFIASDHGNIEDVSVKTHTMNKVPTIIMGKSPKICRIQIQSLRDILPAVLKLFEKDEDYEQ